MEDIYRCELVQRFDGDIADRPNETAGAGLLGLAIGGLGGYALGKKHGYNDGYNQAIAQDAQLIGQYQSQLQNLSCDNTQLRGENNRLLQENISLRMENELLKGLLRQRPATPEAEAILKTLERVEFRLTQVLPPIFEDGEDHDSRRN